MDKMEVLQIHHKRMDAIRHWLIHSNRLVLSTPCPLQMAAANGSKANEQGTIDGMDVATFEDLLHNLDELTPTVRSLRVQFGPSSLMSFVLWLSRSYNQTRNSRI